MSKKVLFLTYYWPPSGGSGVQRPLKFVKYLSNFGWVPIVYTVENPEYPELDESLLKDVPEGLTVLKTPVWEPYNLYKFFTGQKKNNKINPNFFAKNQKRGLKDKVAIWIRSNLFIPDPRMFWIKPSIRFLTQYLAENKVEAIISTGPPHSVHLIAKGLAEKTDLPWIADFRDPWTNIDYFSELNLTSWGLNKHKRLEKEVLTKASAVLVVGNNMKEEFEAITSKPVFLIPNGFDEADYQFDNELILDKKFTILHCGMLGKARNHEAFWIAIKELIAENTEFGNDLEVLLYGKLDASIDESITAHQLQNHVHKKGYIAHNQVANLQRTAQVLLLPLNNSNNAKGVLTGKLFEYLAVQRPILCVGPEDGDAAKIIAEANAGATADFVDKVKIKSILLDFYLKFKNNNLFVAGNDVNKFSRKTLTGELGKVLDGLAES